MSFINSQNGAYVYAKLTDTGRKLLAQGSLTYNYWVFGDSEIDYGFESTTNKLSTNKILSPKDKNLNIKYPISARLNGDIFNTLPAIVPIEQVITNVAKTRGFFTGSTIVPERLKASGSVSTSNIEGGRTVNVNITSGNIAVGDIVMIGLKNPNQSDSATDVPSNVATPHLFYKVEATNGSTGAINITLDRDLPNFDSGSITCKIFVFPGGDSINTFYGSGSTTPYWNNLTLSFESNCNIANDDVPVWNFSVIHTANLAGVNTATFEGIDKFETTKLAGFKEYLNYTSANPLQNAIGVVHYTNNSISNYYGEGFKSGTFKMTLPTVMWHKAAPAGGSGTGSVLGLTLSAKTTSQTLVTDSNKFRTTSIPFSAKYDLLVDNNNNVVGKVFYELKLAVIEDEELLAALSYKSNRNWSLPTLNGTFTSATSDNQGLIGSNQEVYVTYLLANEENFGYSTGLHCTNYTKINRGGTSQNNIKVSFPQNQLPYMKTALGSDGGFTANKLYLLIQKVTTGQKPTPTGWKKIDVTSSIQGYTSGNINPIGLEGSSFTIDLVKYNSGSAYDLNSIIRLPGTTDADKLQFGDEVFLFGNVDAQIVATAYKSSFTFVASASQFNISLNPTFKSNINSAVYISEVGIYNNLKQLVAVGKISKPIEKKSSDTILIQLEIDF